MGVGLASLINGIYEVEGRRGHVKDNVQGVGVARHCRSSVWALTTHVLGWGVFRETENMEIRCVHIRARHSLSVRWVHNMSLGERGPGVTFFNVTALMTPSRRDPIRWHMS